MRDLPGRDVLPGVDAEETGLLPGAAEAVKKRLKGRYAGMKDDVVARPGLRGQRSAEAVIQGVPGGQHRHAVSAPAAPEYLSGVPPGMGRDDMRFLQGQGAGGQQRARSINRIGLCE